MDCHDNSWGTSIIGMISSISANLQSKKHQKKVYGITCLNLDYKLVSDQSANEQPMGG